MTEQYNDAVEKLKDPELRKKYEDEITERERRDYFKELQRESEHLNRIPHATRHG